MHFPTWTPLAVFGGTALVLISMAAMLKPPTMPNVSVAFIGNSMQYYNDMPRLMERLANGHLQQNSCLHGDATLSSILVWGNGMYKKWKTGTARIPYYDGVPIYDYGACTVEQLLFGYDQDLVDLRGDDDGELEYAKNDDFASFYDGTNPCLVDRNYLSYLNDLFDKKGPPTYDFVVMNDNTRAPARNQTRQFSLQALADVYAPWFLETGATPVFISTYGYWSPYRDMGGLVSVPVFTSLTYEGYRQYAELLSEVLPDNQQPRIAPVGLAFLLVWEEKRSLWEKLFHIDWIHASPSGTYLQALVVFYTIYGRMPHRSVALRGDSSSMWDLARRLQPGNHRRASFPTPGEEAYLFNVAVRVCVYKVVPSSFILYQNGESAEYDPSDDLYRVDDLF